MSLSDLKIKKAKVGVCSYKLFDGGGLYLHIMPTGSKIWRFKYKHANKEKLVSFGAYPTISLAEARERLLVAKQLVSRGIDPSNQKREDKQIAVYKAHNTFADVAKEWHETNKTRWNEEHGQKILNRITQHLFPSIGRRAINEIKPLDILALLKKIEANGHYDIAHRVLGYTNNICHYAVITGRIEYSPAGSLSKALKPIPHNHYKTIDLTELPQFLVELENVRTSKQNKIAVKLLLSTGLRTGELRRLKWANINWETHQLLVPPELMKIKTKTPHIVPLSNYSLMLLNELKILTGYSEYILPSQHLQRYPYMCENTINNVIKKTSFKSKLVGHGIRSLFSTTLNEQGFNPDAVERQLAHRERNKVRAAYNHAKYLPERIEMMEWWGSFIFNLG